MQRLVVRVRGARAREVSRWIRALLPAAVLLVGTAAPPGPGCEEDDDRAITVDADAIPSGPLALADTLARRLR